MKMTCKQKFHNLELKWIREKIDNGKTMNRMKTSSIANEAKRLSCK